ncbi:hypothetical protein MTP99_009025 [Tenebrio molitor]|jgi:hypothetical protein|nr:hypothetical protein MTP99_009025 [Tenebrio molitor]
MPEGSSPSHPLGRGAALHKEVDYVAVVMKGSFNGPGVCTPPFRSLRTLISRSPVNSGLSARLTFLPIETHAIRIFNAGQRCVNTSAVAVHSLRRDVVENWQYSSGPSSVYPIESF